MSIPEALKGAQVELARIHSPVEKIKRVAAYVRIIGAELLGTLTMVPYGIRAFTLHRSLPDAKWQTSRGRPGVVSVARDVRYHDAGARNTMDIYLPADANIGGDDSSSGDGRRANDVPGASLSLSREDSSGKPVVLFCHGGIWATGDKWHYSPMAVRLAQAGVITAVMHYTLYPQALAPTMAEEVSRALSWTLDNVRKLGGDEKRVTLAGHSAGAQLCAMALLHRASSGIAGARDTAVHISPKELGGTAKEERIDDAYADSRMPWQFLGMAGVYDIAKHFEYEEARGVHELSTMGRAVGGPDQFAANSPCVLLKNTIAKEGLPSCRPTPPQKASGNSLSRVLPNVLQGDAIAARIGLSSSQVKGTSISAAVPAVPDISLSAVRRLPLCVLQSSCSDVTVPWYESSDLFWALTDCGVPARSLVYNRIGHGDFVVGWHPLPSPMTVHSTTDLPDYAADLVAVVGGEINI